MYHSKVTRHQLLFFKRTFWCYKVLHLGVGTFGHRWAPMVGTVWVDTVRVGTVSMGTVMVSTIRVGTVRVGTVRVGTVRVDTIGWAPLG